MGLPLSLKFAFRWSFFYMPEELEYVEASPDVKQSCFIVLYVEYEAHGNWTNVIFWCVPQVISMKKILAGYWVNYLFNWCVGRHSSCMWFCCLTKWHVEELLFVDLFSLASWSFTSQFHCSGWWWRGVCQFIYQNMKYRKFCKFDVIISM